MTEWLGSILNASRRIPPRGAPIIKNSEETTGSNSGCNFGEQL